MSVRKSATRAGGRQIFAAVSKLETTRVDLHKLLRIY